MVKRLLERLRGARGIEWFAALALAALLALMLLNHGGATARPARRWRRGWSGYCSASRARAGSAP